MIWHLWEREEVIVGVTREQITMKSYCSNPKVWWPWLVQPAENWIFFHIVTSITPQSKAWAKILLGPFEDMEGHGYKPSSLVETRAPKSEAYIASSTSQSPYFFHVVFILSSKFLAPLIGLERKFSHKHIEVSKPYIYI
jgi:hypothetical protein